jgi:predicted Zn finger-like uncharacterized protein
MIINCPNCHSKYRIADENVNPEGSRVRCSFCKHIFTVTPEDAVAEAEEREEEGREEESQEEISGTDESEEASFKEQAEADLDKMKEQAEDEYDQPLQIEIGSESKSKVKPKWLWLLSTLLLIMLIGGAFFLFPKLQGVLPFLDSAQEKEKPAQVEATPEAEVKDIELQNVRQYFVNNEKIGELFVIEGKAVNNFSKAKELIKIQAQLYDEAGNSLTSKTFMCGNTVSLFQLQVLQKDELHSALTAKTGILSNNTNLAPGEGVPFMVVFYNPSEKVKEFGLKVVQAKNPPEG